jgi:hypothetical protein
MYLKKFLDYTDSISETKRDNFEAKKNFRKGSFNNYVDRILPFFDPPPLRGHFLYPERGQKQTFFDPLPPFILST